MSGGVDTRAEDGHFGLRPKNLADRRWLTVTFRALVLFANLFVILILATALITPPHTISAFELIVNLLILSWAAGHFWHAVRPIQSKRARSVLVAMNIVPLILWARGLYFFLTSPYGRFVLTAPYGIILMFREILDTIADLFAAMYLVTPFLNISYVIFQSRRHLRLERSRLSQQIRLNEDLGTLEQLAHLRDKGVISEEDYRAKRRVLLDLEG